MQQLMISFDGYTAPPAILAAVERGEIASFCLFDNKNVESPSQLRDLCAQLQAAAHRGGHPPVIIGIDQEGGQLMAISGGTTELAGNMALGATRSPKLAEEAGRVLGRELLAMGINLNFAPSVDVNINPANPVIGTRSFGDDPQVVGELGAALVRGLQKEGVLANAKHFPGHGDTSHDTHHGSAIIDHPLERLKAVELYPFRQIIEAGVEAIMTAHIVMPALDPNSPATLSHKILTGLLREEMGFENLIITDAMDMYAVARYGREESVRRALEAGADLVLLGHVEDQLELIPHFAPMLNAASLQRIRATQAKLTHAQPDFAVIGSAEHQKIAREIAEQSITLVRQGGNFPLKPQPEDTIAVIVPIPENLTPADTSADVKIQLGELIQARHGKTQIYTLPLQPSSAQIAEILGAVAQADHIIVGTINADYDDGFAILVRELCQRGQQPLVAALRIPYDLMSFPMVETYLCTYSIRPPSIAALVRVLFGEIQAQGVLPCQLPLPDLI